MPREFQQAPGGGQLWKVGSTYYLAYQVPKAQPPIWMTWKVEDDSQLDAIVGPSGNRNPDRTMSQAQFRKTGALNFGGSTELVNYDAEPFEKLIRDFDLEARVQPWLKDPEVLAYVTGAMLEGRQVTQAELANTDYFRNHSQAELDWAVLKATDPKTAAKQQGDARLQVQSMLRERGIDAPRELIDLLAGRWAGGQWTETMVSAQIQGLADPYQGIDLDPEVVNVARGFNPESGDRKTLSQGRNAVRKRVSDIFTNRQVDAGTHLDGSTVDADERIDRITDDIVSGKRSFADVRAAVNRQAGLHPTSEIDLTREGEAEVQQLLVDWLGPQLAKQYEGRWTRGWAGKLRSDPDAQTELVEELKALRVAAMPEWTNENLRYADIAPTAKALFEQTGWGVADETDPLFMDVLRMTGQGTEGGLTAAAAKLRREGLKREVSGVTQQASEGILAAGGGSVRASLV